MSKRGPIIICEDDKDDIDILEQIFTNLGVKNQRHYFDDGKPILDFLRTIQEPPFIIISNVKVSGMDGLELREEIQKDEQLRTKGIPFVYLSTDSRQEVVKKAFELTVQGFFEKQNTIEGVQQQLESILSYWSNCKHPNS